MADTEPTVKRGPGRPPNARPTKKITINLDEALYERVAKVAHDQGMNASELIRRAILLQVWAAEKGYPIYTRENGELVRQSQL